MIVYAKCIRTSQIAHSHEEFIERQNEEYTVYCVGETSVAKENGGDLYCVPLNYIYCCLRYGYNIAIIDVPNDLSSYPTETESTFNRSKIAMREQKVLKIIRADSKEAVDFLADTIPNHRCIVKSSYPSAWLSDEFNHYFDSKIPNHI